MKKLLCSLLFCIFTAGIFADSLIEAAKNRDYELFESLVLSGASLKETDNNGMNVQLSLAYFDDEDFTKACKLLHKKKFNFDVPAENNISLLYVLCYSCSYNKLETLLNYKVNVNRKNSITKLNPIDATQFSTFKFYSEQKIDPSAYENAEKVRKLLLNHGSEDFKYVNLTIGNVGNFFFSIFNILYTMYPFITPSSVTYSELYDFTTVNGQTSATLKNDELINLFKRFGMDVEIQNYYEAEEIPVKLKEAMDSEDAYFLVAFTGNSPVTPYQCIGINGLSDYVNVDGNTSINANNPDGLYTFVSYQVKDLSQLITIRVLNH